MPLSTDNVVVTAEIEGASSVDIEWELNGVAQTDVAMTNTTGNTWTGTIPSQSNGARVFFRVAADDGTNATELSAGAGYFSGITPISTLRANDGDGVLLYKTYGVRVEGSLTVEPGIFHDTVTQAFVQDATGGVQIFDNDLLALSRGDVVQFTGEAEQFGGATEVSIAENWGNYGYTWVSSGSPPAAQVLTISSIDEGEEGELVRINGVTITSGSIPESGSGSITVTDNGGTNTLTLRVDDATDIPGANSPTGSFDIVGVISQFDSWVPFNSGFQIQPREKTDFVSTEVNHPQVPIAEIHADPESTILGDANGDGTRDATNDEFIELINTGFTAIDISGWTLHDALSLRHTFASGTILPPREATVVFGGGTPTGAFGNAAANSLVFVASTRGLVAQEHQRRNGDAQEQLGGSGAELRLRQRSQRRQIADPAELLERRLRQTSAGARLRRQPSFARRPHRRQRLHRDARAACRWPRCSTTRAARTAGSNGSSPRPPPAP